MQKNNAAYAFAVLFIAVGALSACVLGLYLFSYFGRNLAIRRLAAADVVLKRKADFPDGTLWHDGILGGSEAFSSASQHSIVYCSFAGKPATQDQLADLSMLQHISMLDLSSTELSGGEIVAVAFEHPRLTCLWADDTALESSDLRRLLSHPSLLVISVTGTSVDRKTADELSGHRLKIHADRSFRMID